MRSGSSGWSRGRRAARLISSAAGQTRGASGSPPKGRIETLHLGWRPSIGLLSLDDGLNTRVRALFFSAELRRLHALERRSVCPKELPKNAPSLSRGGVFRPLCLRLLHDTGALVSLGSRLTGRTGRRSRAPISLSLGGESSLPKLLSKRNCCYRGSPWEVSSKAHVHATTRDVHCAVATVS
jgi:hypothetical protein